MIVNGGQSSLRCFIRPDDNGTFNDGSIESYVRCNCARYCARVVSRVKINNVRKLYVAFFGCVFDGWSDLWVFKIEMHLLWEIVADMCLLAIFKPVVLTCGHISASGKYF